MKTIILFIALSVNVLAQNAQIIYYYNGSSYRRSGQGEIGSDSAFTATASVTSSGNIASKPNMHFGANGLIYKSTDTTSKVSFYIDNVLVAVHTSTLPTSSTLLGYGCQVTTLTAGPHNIRVSRISIQQK